jgi:hypothetical protein
MATPEFRRALGQTTDMANQSPLIFAPFEITFAVAARDGQD